MNSDNPYYIPPQSFSERDPNSQPNRFSFAPALQGALQLGSQMYDDVNAYKQYDGSVPRVQVDESGRPTYNLGGAMGRVNSMGGRQVVGSSAGAVGRGAMTGAQAGAMIGGPVGGFAGAVVGGLGGGIANAIGHNKAEAAQERAARQLRQAQKNFNRQNIGYHQGQLSQMAYNDQVSNPYGIPLNYY
jgi:hypothetical protein